MESWKIKKKKAHNIQNAIHSTTDAALKVKEKHKCIKIKIIMTEMWL